MLDTVRNLEINGSNAGMARAFRGAVRGILQEGDWAGDAEREFWPDFRGYLPGDDRNGRLRRITPDEAQDMADRLRRCLCERGVRLP